MGREHAVEFARAVFNASIAANGANGANGAEGDTETVTEGCILQYFKAHPEEKYHLLGPSFTWDAFFKGIHDDVRTNKHGKHRKHGKDGKDGKDRRFDVNRFITAIVKVRRRNNEDGGKSLLVYRLYRLCLE